MFEKDKIYIETYAEEDDKYSLLKYDLNNSSSEEISLNLQPGEYISRLFVDDNDRIYISTGTDAIEADFQNNRVQSINSDGKTDIFIDDDFKDGENVQYSAFMQEDNDGNLIVFTDKTAYIFDENHNKKSSLSYDAGVDFIDSACTKNGEVVVAFLEKSAQSNIIISKINSKDNKFDNITTIQSDIYNALMDGNDEDLYINGSDGVYILDTNTGDMELLFSFSNSYIYPSSAERMASSDGASFVTSEFGENEKLYLTYVSKQGDINNNKRKIVLAACGIPTSLVNNVNDYNIKNSDCYIEIKDYSTEEDPDMAMALDVVSESCPDIICFDSGFCPSDYIAQKLLEDLSLYIDKDDDLEKSDIMEPVLNALESDNHIYFSASNYFLRTLIVKSKNIEDGSEGWTYKEMINAFENSGCKKLYQYESSEDLLFDLGYLGLNDYLNWDNGTCNIDSSEFSDYLQACKKYGEYGNEGTYISEGEMVEESYQKLEDFNDGRLFAIDCQGFDPSNCQIYKTLYGNDITYIGYPNASRKGSYFDLTGKYGIFANSTNKEDAWSFVRTFFTEEYQANNMMEVMPCRKDCFEEKIKEFTAKENYINKYGKEITSLNNIGSWDAYGISIKLRPCTDEEIKDYMDVLNRTDTYYDLNSTIIGIMKEESEAYFSGNKKLNNQVKVMQSKIGLYMSEHH